jgi:hypothetical protein
MKNFNNTVIKESKRGKTVKRSPTNSIHHQLSVINNNTSIYIINDVTDIDECESAKIPCDIGVKTKNTSDKTDDIYTQFATIFFKTPHVIMIPAIVKTLIERRLPKHYLDKIHGGEKTKENRDVAVELCLLFLSQLSSTHRNILNGKSPDGWKSLRAEYLRQLLRIDDKTYQCVKKALLKFQYDLGPILEERFYVKGKHSYGYRLGESFRSKGYFPYKLKTKQAQDLFRRSCERKLRLAEKNIICVNLIEFYKSITLPTEQEIVDEGRRLIKEGYYNKKGKKLIFRNKKVNAYFPDVANLSFIEDALKIFKYLTKNGVMIPRPGNEKSGGRVVDSFALMPLWIRKLVKINGQPVAEADYSCLHPNIAMSLYGGNSPYLTHEHLAKQLGIDKKIVKIEHLSFFNKRVEQMKRSLLFEYYKKYEPEMVDAIIRAKEESEHGHKITCRCLFAKEVEIMTEVVSRLNEEGIFVGYIYDALFFDPVHSEKVVEVMDEVAADLRVYTSVKL